MTTRALVLGVNGQDGSYLAEQLLARGHTVIGVGRQSDSRYLADGAGFEYASLDLTDLRGLDRLLEARRPDLLCHFAAVHGPAGFAYEPLWRELQLVNVAVTHCLLEHLRSRAHGGHLLFPSSSKVFGSQLPALVSEATPRVSSCLYSITKNASHELIDHYRNRHGVGATVVHLFNHESPRRLDGFLIPKLVKVVGQALSGAEGKVEVRTLDFHANWGDAREFMELCSELAEGRVDVDVIMAHERTWYGADLVESLFTRHGLDHRKHVSVRQQGSRSMRFDVDTGRLERLLNRRPTRGILDVCDDILHEYRSRMTPDGTSEPRDA